jgi:radical SAM superfamily enzyme YgiQ (UPF0313 family)
METKTGTRHKKNPEQEKILLVLLPYWTPLIPPVGISCLKSFLQQHGYHVITADANIIEEFKKIYNEYFAALEEAVPANKKGNFFSIGHDVLQNHMTAYLNYENKREYIELIKTLVFKTFYCRIHDDQALELHKTIDEFYTRLENYILSLLEKENPAILGISVNSCTLPASIFAFELTRRKYPHIKTVMGGGIFCDQLAPRTPNFETLLETSKDYIDNIIVGEGEILFLKLLRGELPPSQRVFTPSDINREALDLSAVEAPDFSDLDLQLYPYLSAYASRGCPFQCSFCSDSLMWGKYRKKKAKQVVEELTRLSRKHDYQLFMLSDLLLNPVMADISNEFINSGTAVYWDGCLRADKDACSIKNTQLWRRGGFYRARLGLESGSQRVLQLMGKKVTPAQIKEAVSCLAFTGIQTTTLWIVGYPGETEEDFIQTLNLIEELKDDIYEAECRPFYYYLTGQANSARWEKENKHIPLYPAEMEKLLLFQTWILDGLPSREETYQRVNRFVQHCDKLGIPNIYSLHDTYKADERWKKLHKNAVPPLLEFKKRGVYIKECKYFEEAYFIQDTVKEDGDFGF